MLKGRRGAGSGKVVVLFSGGLDSTVLLHHLHQAGWTVCPLFLAYGGRSTTQEMKAARKVAVALGTVPVRAVKVESYPLLVQRGSIMRSGPIPSKGQACFGAAREEMYAPARNLVLLSLATAYAIQTGAEAVGFAAHSAPYPHLCVPDCRPEFVTHFHAAMLQCCEEGVDLVAPFVHGTKADVVKIGARLGTPLDLTYTCHTGAPEHCGACGACQERRWAFKAAGVPDPTRYTETPALTGTPG